ncbi:ATPase [Mycolicibacterium aromaticivorans JS19b1 = JCM 16368]|uniref:histidine kinase n=1 Tax=Mycolicibacterium aromaticivorans JS19b1 = JCM 16368 TaxID=1440774 RepID=A0A064CNX5_9MYCO|nr:HAMP domain-containing sensor histidine kinase [Mycolicibacterium aromaticivorans]KDF02066.1 ATPase [Mycolicibacterium aromaticivorans JS19b1 = JCM 16368]
MTQTSTATPSLRRRLVLAVLGLLAVLVTLLGVSVDVVMGVQARRDLHDRLMATAARADSLDRAGVAPDQLVAQTQGGGIRARLITPDGHSYGDASLPSNGQGVLTPPPPPSPAGGGPPGPPGGGPPPKPPLPPPPEQATATAITHPLPDRSLLVLVADTTATTVVLGQLRMIIIVSALLVLLIASAAATVLIRSAMRPLDRLTAVAGAITAGDRGRRLHPDRPNTELGRAATAFDNMLDALEQSEHRARQSATDAADAEKATRQFLADAAHELRTPIAGIQAGAERIMTTASQTAGAQSDQQRHRAQLVLTETRRAGRLVADMLDLSRIDNGLHIDWQACDLAIIADQERDRAEMFSPSITIIRTGPATLPILTDPQRVAQILANLTENARRYTPDGGTVTIDLSRTASRAEIIVSDTGPGVAAAEHERIFERLVRLDAARSRDHGGAGLGLPIARGLARALGGNLTCVPRGTGAHFLLSLPLSRPTN